MRDCDDGPAAHQAIQCLADGFFRLAVERRGCFIEQKNWRILEERAGNADALPLPGRQPHAPVADNRCNALRKIFDEVAAIGRDDRLLYVRIRGVWPTVADVLHDRAVKQGYVLWNDGDGGPQALLGHPRKVLTPKHNAPALHIVETLQQHEEGRFASVLHCGRNSPPRLRTRFRADAVERESRFWVP